MTGVKTKKPKFASEGREDIFSQLRSHINYMVALLEPRKRNEILFKAFLFPTLFFATWVIALFAGHNIEVFYVCYVGMGLFIVLNYLNGVHDAVHYNIFHSRRLNELYVYLFDLMGANSFIWKMRHVRFHHNYPNVDGWDTDIDQSALVRVAPGSPISKFHRYQHIYLPFIYPLFLFNWLLVRDFKDFFDKSRTVRKLVDIPRKEYIKLFLFKAFFLFYMIVVPKLVLDISWLVVIGAFLLMILTASIFALIVLLPPHANIDATFPIENESGELPDSWFMHMIKTTNDIDGTSWFTKAIMGNYNFHIAHHLFPNIHHIFYPEITQKLREICNQNNIPYRSYPLGTALRKHYLLLKQNAGDFNIWEEDM
jgi:linoleoyl-CoA desaturase